MEILLSPRTSANVWLKARKLEARDNAKAAGWAVDESFAISNLIPKAGILKESQQVPLSELRFSVCKSELLALERELGVGKLSLAASSEPSRRHRAHDNWVLIPKALRGENVFELAEGIYICSPAVSFFSVANSLSSPALCQMLTELCGEYALDPAISCGFGRCMPLLSPSLLSEKARYWAGSIGVRSIRRALPYAEAGSESPRETIMQLQISLPSYMGGAQLPAGAFGHEIALRAKARQIYGRKTCRCDLFYKEARLDLEYESDQEHAGDANRKKDARREAALALEGVEVIPITSQEVESISQMNAIADLVAKRLGIRRRIRVRDYPLLQLELFETLLSRRDWSF